MTINIPGMKAVKSPIYHGRYECVFYGRKGVLIKDWIRNKFGEKDDMIYANSDIDSSLIEDCGALLTNKQLCFTILRWA